MEDPKVCPSSLRAQRSNLPDSEAHEIASSPPATLPLHFAQGSGSRLRLLAMTKASVSFTDPDFGKALRDLRGQTQSQVTLVATVHQPNDALGELTRATLPRLQALYGALVFLCSQTTSAEMLTLLRASGATVHHECQQPMSLSGIGRVRRHALRLGLTTGCDHLHLCDFDRLLHWAAHYPDELQQVVGEIANYDLLLLGRTERALATHPPYQAETERLANLIFSKVYGPERDITSGSRGLSRRTAERLLIHSHDEGAGVDAEWPLIVSCFPELRSGYILCEGLEFETADRYQAEIAQAGGLERWLEAQSARPELWVQRLRVACEIAEAALQAAVRLTNSISCTKIETKVRK